MKRYLLSILLVFAGLTHMQAQDIAQGIRYQAVARNAVNQPMLNLPVSITITIASDNSAQNVHFIEHHETMTNEQGLFVVNIGQGKPKNGALADVPWANQELWLKVELSEKDQNAYTVVSNNRFMAVPYALHAASASALSPPTDGSTEKFNDSQEWTIAGNTGIVPNFQFLGNTDNQDLYLKTSNTTRVIFSKKGQMRINSNLNGDESSSTSYPLTVQGSDQGIYIQVSGSRSNANNFMTFADNTQVWGAVEGETDAELKADWEYKLEINKFILEGVSLAIEIGIEIAVGSAEAASGLDAGGAVGTFLKVAGFVAKAVNVLSGSITYVSKKSEELGVAYATGGADYAEWLERKVGEPKLHPGQIVGVKGGKISLNTNDADHYRVISWKPGVVGNLPKPGLMPKSEKVAFMGQVKVNVVGPVEQGDYIIPSGNNDGYGIAVAPNKMKIGDYIRIVGVAWEAGKSTTTNCINVAIGIGSNELSQQIELLEQKVKTVKGFLKSGASPQALDPALANSLSTATDFTTAQKQLSDEAFDQFLDQHAGLVNEIFAKVNTGLQQQEGLNMNAHPEMAAFFADPLAMIKKIRRDPGLVTQWALMDQKILNKK
ncbi:hypothetical protein [Haliscomenobacter sp.]|uniref:hypothetical protein n=1 Tax=Haliscomenobacter sp. TaxID=2717303 RepID=UPI00336524A1